MDFYITTYAKILSLHLICLSNKGPQHQFLCNSAVFFPAHAYNSAKSSIDVQLYSRGLVDKS